jgi:asparagine synthase (glutamine-hydrolysing)
MCGIAGFWQSRAACSEELQDRARVMGEALRGRGPDDSGVWADASSGVSLAHRRLSVVDLSAEGRCPMVSASGRYVITYNGEVYNCSPLRGQLEGSGHRFRGRSDTEVILAAVDEWGLDRAIERFAGMFAFAVWDRKERQLVLVRDRLGIKPLFVYQRSGVVMFGSELKALRRHPAFIPLLDRDVLHSYLRYRYVAAPGTIYVGAFKVPPGHVLRITDPDQALPTPECYWSPIEAATRGLADPFQGSADEATTALTDLLADVVSGHMLSDVPLGAFLSGGVDSSVIVALMQRQSRQPIRTFSIGSHSGAYDERTPAAAVAQCLGTDHTEIAVSGEEALAVVPVLADVFDEPFADASQIPTYLVSRLARRAVTVSLSGDGGDELFGGYTRHQWVPRIWRVSPILRRPLQAGIQAVSPGNWDRIVGLLGPVLPRAARVRLMGHKLHKIAAVRDFSSQDTLYRAVASAYQAPDSLLVAPSPTTTDHVLAALREIPLARPIDRMMLCDLMTYLPDDILTKLDRCSMAVSLEGRVPLLDHRVVEFAWRLRHYGATRGGQGKWLLRQVLYRLVPRQLVDRPKSGFDVPIDEWLRGPLRSWAEHLLDAQRLRQVGLFDPTEVRRLLSEHLSGRRNWRDILWGLLMFEAWRERWEPAIG